MHLLFKWKLSLQLSLSNCQLQCIDSSLKSCTELKELRLSHNEIKVCAIVNCLLPLSHLVHHSSNNFPLAIFNSQTLPSELACNTKLQNLDIGNNEIMRWSDLKVGILWQNADVSSIIPPHANVM